MTSAASVGRRRAIGLRAQIVLIVLGVVIVPLTLVGVWTARSGMRSGETLLRSHLEASADGFVKATARRWEFRQSDLVYLSQNASSVRVLRGVADAADRAFLDALAADVAPYIQQAELRDSSGVLRWSSNAASRAAADRARSEAGGPSAAAARGLEPSIRVQMRVTDPAGAQVGTAVVDVAVSGLVPPDSARPLVPGAEVALQEVNALSPVVPMSAVRDYPRGDAFTAGRERWLVVHRRLEGPEIDVAIAAPLAPYVAPFKRAAVIGLAAILVTSALAVMLLLALTQRMLRPLEELARASDAIAAGRLDERVAVRGPRELQRVASTFNLMIESLRDTLDTLSRRTALAAVGEFATSLSHDVRNALTSIKVDLDRLAVRDLADPTARSLVSRSLNSVARLEASVAGALRVARRGSSPMSAVDVGRTIRRAADRVEGTMAAIPATLELVFPSDPVVVRGDAPALEQLFANLLFNAAQALGPGGMTRVTIGEEPGGVRVTFADSGSGMAPQDLAALDRPFYSTKPSGTGLGLPIARQIVAAHGGTLTIESESGRGTHVVVRLPIGTDRSHEVNESVVSAGQPPIGAIGERHVPTTS